MKKTFLLCFSLMFVLFAACAEDANSRGETNGDGTMNITLTIGSKIFHAKLEDNSTARALVSLFPLTLDMSELNGNEYYNYLNTSLPTASANPKRINAGDIKLYGSNCVVIFYKSFSTSYSYTTLGAIDAQDELLEALRQSNGKVMFSLSE